MTPLSPNREPTLMALLRRTARPSPPPPPGDWMDALQAAMRVDPALRPKRDRPSPMDGPELPPRPPGEIPRRFRTQPAGRRFTELLPEPEPAPEAPSTADAPPPPPSPSAPVEKPWLLPVPLPAAAPLAVANATPPATVEPVLLWACHLSRLRRAGPPPDAFDAVRLRADADRLLSAVPPRLRPPMGSFVDLVMTRGGLPLVGRWQPIGPVPPGPAYGAAAAEAAGDPTGLHDGTWAAHHAALTLVADLLPPAGDFPGGPAILDALDAKLHGVEPDADGPGVESTDARICPDAYAGVFGLALVRPVGGPLRAVAAAGVGLLLLAVAGSVLLNLRYVAQMRGSVDAVDRSLHEPPPPPSGAAASAATDGG